MKSRCGRETFEQVIPYFMYNLYHSRSSVLSADLMCQESKRNEKLLCRDSIVELHFHSSFTQSIQTQLTSIIYENPLSDILKIWFTMILYPPLAEVRFALRFFYVIYHFPLFHRANYCWKHPSMCDWWYCLIIRKKNGHALKRNSRDANVDSVSQWEWFQSREWDCGVATDG